jgi:hypothetical protein
LKEFSDNNARHNRGPNNLDYENYFQISSTLLTSLFDDYVEGLRQNDFEFEVKNKSKKF